ncbi:hypothetical protein HY095_04060 [Candidatus Micrarchaeota archaeon]|nr:hypothetical protein [Candidatus Micrarchaeota archaeon]
MALLVRKGDVHEARNNLTDAMLKELLELKPSESRRISSIEHVLNRAAFLNGMMKIAKGLRDLPGTDNIVAEIHPAETLSGAVEIHLLPIRTDRLGSWKAQLDAVMKEAITGNAEFQKEFFSLGRDRVPSKVPTPSKVERDWTGIQIRFKPRPKSHE